MVLFWNVIYVKEVYGRRRRRRRSRYLRMRRRRRFGTVSFFCEHDFLKHNVIWIWMINSIRIRIRIKPIYLLVVVIKTLCFL